MHEQDNKTKLTCSVAISKLGPALKGYFDAAKDLNVAIEISKGIGIGWDIEINDHHNPITVHAFYHSYDQSKGSQIDLVVELRGLPRIDVDDLVHSVSNMH